MNVVDHYAKHSDSEQEETLLPYDAHHIVYLNEVCDDLYQKAA